MVCKSISREVYQALFKMAYLFAFLPMRLMRNIEISKHTFLWFDLGQADPLIYFTGCVARNYDIYSAKTCYGRNCWSKFRKMAMMNWVNANHDFNLCNYLITQLALSLLLGFGNIFGIAQMLLDQRPEIKASKAARIKQSEYNYC